MCSDEIDAIGTKRYESQSGGEREIQRTMLELLNQMDGFDSMGDVKVGALLVSLALHVSLAPISSLCQPTARCAHHPRASGANCPSGPHGVGLILPLPVQPQFAAMQCPAQHEYAECNPLSCHWLPLLAPSLICKIDTR